jgi:tripartite-type tricarboxylate transporter receptor subunit TctC
MKRYAALVLALGIGLAPSMLRAQDAWPARPITFLVPYGAGGYTDLVARLTARYVEKALGKPVIVDSRPGAGGIVAVFLFFAVVP